MSTREMRARRARLDREMLLTDVVRFSTARDLAINYRNAGRVAEARKYAGRARRAFAKLDLFIRRGRVAS